MVEIRKEATLSDRGKAAAAIGEVLSGVKDVFGDPYDEETNPDGFILLGVAENGLMRKELTRYFERDFHLAQSDFSYSSSLTGSTRLHTALSSLFNAHFNPRTPVLPTHLTTATGASAILNRLVPLLANPGEAILIVAPYYAGFDTDITCDTDVRILGVQLKPEEMFGVREIEKVEVALKSARDGSGSGEGTLTKTKVSAIILCNPQNPLGRCYPRETIVAYGRLCEKYSLHLISDEIYALSVFPNTSELSPSSSQTFTSVLSFNWKSMSVNPSRIHVVYGMSKDFSSNGFRIGVFLSQSNPTLLSAMLKTIPFDMISSPSDSLWSTLLNDKAYLEWYITENRRRLADAYTFLTGWLKHHKIPYHPSNAAHFLMADFTLILTDVLQYGSLLSFPSTSDLPTREKALIKALFDRKIFAAPPSGGGYHYPTPGWLRLTFSIERGEMRVVLGRMERLFGWGRWEGLDATYEPGVSAGAGERERERRVKRVMSLTQDGEYEFSIGEIALKEFGLNGMTNAMIYSTSLPSTTTSSKVKSKPKPASKQRPKSTYQPSRSTSSASGSSTTSSILRGIGAERLKDLVEKVMWRGGSGNGNASVDANGSAEAIQNENATDPQAAPALAPAPKATEDNQSTNPDDLSKQFIQEGPGGTKFFVQDLEPGCEVPLHESQTTDYIIMLEGKVQSLIPEGIEFDLKEGEVMVRHAGVHGWKNPSHQRARWAAVIISD